jgi:hypothetical protein
MSDDQELETPPEQAEVSTTPPSPDGGDPAPAEPGDAAPSEKPEDSAPPAEAEKPDPQAHRRKLIAQLTGEVDPPKDEDPPEDQPAEQAKAPEETPADPPAPEAKKQEPEPPQADDLNEVTNDSIRAMKPGEARRKINRLITRYKEAAPLADLGREIIQACEKNGLSPDDYRAWVALGMGVSTGDENAIKQLVAFSQRFNQKPADPPPPAPADDTEAWLKKQVDEMNISPAAADELRKRLAPKAPPPAQPAVPPAAPQRRGPAPEYAAAQQRAYADLDRIEAEYEKKLGTRWQEVKPRVIEALKAKAGRHPDAWGDIYRSSIEAELARAPKPPPIQPGLRPGTGASAGSGTPQFKSERERVIHSYTG